VGAAGKPVFPLIASGRAADVIDMDGTGVQETAGVASRPAEARGAAMGIVVLGPFRSGTSLVSQLLAELGVDFGPGEPLLGGDKYNPGGYFERGDVNHVNGRLLETAGRTFAEPGAPDTLAREADTGVFDEINCTWLGRGGRWGIKDPRMCATLLTWIEAGRIRREGLRIVQVKRDTEAVVRSAWRYPGVNHYFGGRIEEIREGVRRYESLAQWHVDHLGVPTFVLCYEELLAAPGRTVMQLGGFIGVDDRRLIRRAASGVGKRKAHLRRTVRRAHGRVMNLLRRAIGLGMEATRRSHPV